MGGLSGHMVRGYNRRELIGAGGFGAVYRAHEPAVDHEVAIKVILRQHACVSGYVACRQGTGGLADLCPDNASCHCIK
jgi:hypothetical protein